MSDIFISYASEDRDRVKPLAKALENQGWSVWWDRTIPPGKTFDQVIEEAINAARCVVVLWSKISIKSDWVKEEANIGKERNILVPARIDPVDLPLGFGSHAGFAVFLSAISDIVGPPPQQEKPEQVVEIPESSLEQQLEVKSKESETVQPAPSHLKPEEKESPITGLKAPRRKRLVFGIGAVALILVLGVIGWFFFLKTITVSSGPNGDIRREGQEVPTGEVAVTRGDSIKFEIEPSPGYRIADVVVDGKSVGAVSSYTFERVTRDRTIVASFVAKTNTITASSGPNGSISPSGSVTVTHGESMAFTIKPSQDYRIADVKVDGKSVEQRPKYEFKNVTEDHTISASFVKTTYTIKASSGPNGSISPPGEVLVAHGDSKRFTITPSPGYRIAAVKVDGSSVGALSSYTFKDVTGDRTISASFELKTFIPKPPPIPERAKLLNKNSSKYLAVADAGTDDNANIVIWDDMGQRDIRWALEPQGKNRYKIRNLNSGKYLAVSGAAVTNGGNVIQWRDMGQQDILWELKRVDSSCYKIRNVNSGKYLAVAGVTGPNVVQWEDGGQADIVWCLK